MHPLEMRRREMILEVNQGLERKALEIQHGQVWNTEELQDEFVVVGFMAPCVVVVRKSDQATGSMLFQHSPRYYWGFSIVEDN